MLSEKKGSSVPPMMSVLAGRPRCRSQGRDLGRVAQCRGAKRRSPARWRLSAASCRRTPSFWSRKVKLDRRQPDVRSTTPLVQHYEPFLGSYFLLSKRSQTKGRRYGNFRAGASPRKRRTKLYASAPTTIVMAEPTGVVSIDPQTVSSYQPRCRGRRPLPSTGSPAAIHAFLPSPYSQTFV